MRAKVMWVDEGGSWAGFHLRETPLRETFFIIDLARNNGMSGPFPIRREIRGIQGDEDGRPSLQP